MNSIKYLVTFAEGKPYTQSQKNIDKTLSIAEIDEHIMWNLKKLKQSNFYKDNKQLLDIERGYGYWSWKPYIILEQLEKINEDDILIYMDASRYETDGFKNSCKNVVQFMHNNSVDLLVGFRTNNKNWEMIKDKCLINFDLIDNEQFKKLDNVFTSPMFLRKTEKNIEFIKEWLEGCLNIDNVSHEDLSYKGGKIHIYDQAVLNCLLYKHSIISYKPDIDDELEFRKFTYYFDYFKNLL